MGIITIALLSVAVGLSSGEKTQPTGLELDHLYICVAVGAPEASVLENAGLRLAVDTAHHTGQGTASVFFAFENMYLELTWVEDSVELATADQELADKFNNAAKGGSPFGLGLRRSEPITDSLPFQTKSYYQAWMREGSAIEIAQTNHRNEPEVFVVPTYMGHDSLLAMATAARPERLEDLKHPAEITKLTKIRISGPGLPGESQTLAELSERGIVIFSESTKQVAELTFDRRRQGKTIDARPDLPLVIHY